MPCNILFLFLFEDNHPVLSMPAQAAAPSLTSSLQAAAPSLTSSLVVASTGGPVSTTPAQVLVTSSSSSSNGAQALPLQHPATLTSPLSLANGITPHFPMFYHHTYVPTPTYQVPMAAIQGTAEAQDEDGEEQKDE